MLYKSYFTIFVVNANLFIKTMISYVRCFLETDFSNARKKSMHCGDRFLVISRYRSLFNPFDGETLSHPFTQAKRFFQLMSWRLLCRARFFVHKRTRKFGPVPPLRIHPTVGADHPPQMLISPAGSHCARWCAPGGASKRSGSWRTTTPRRRPPSVVGAVRASVQRFRELLRETGVAWSAREVRSVSPLPVHPFVIVIVALSGHRLGTTALGVPRLRNNCVGWASQYYVVPGRRDVYLLGGCRKIFYIQAMENRHEF